MDTTHGRPLPGHRVTPLVDGANAFASVYRDLQLARWRIYIATWALEDDFAIERGPRGDRRLADACRAALAAHPGLEIYLLVWDWEMVELPLAAGIWWPGTVGIAPEVPPVPNGDVFANPADRGRLHCALEGNPVAGSHHQKLVLCDLTGAGDPSQPSASVHCLGLNMQNTCWDRPDHPFPKAYRDSSTLWHDTGARVEGPVVAAFEHEFIRRWRDATGDELPPHQFANPLRGQTRVTALVHPEQTKHPSPIKDWYVAAIRGARDLLYLENQYFDDAEVARAIWETYLAREATGTPLAAALVLPW